MAVKYITALTDAKVLDGDLDKLRALSPNIDARTFGPYDGSYYLTIRGWCSGTDGDDDSTADLAMYIDDILVGGAHDQHFNNYYLHVDKTIRLQALSSVLVTIKHTNDHGPRETGWSVDLIGVSPA